LLHYFPNNGRKRKLIDDEFFDYSLETSKTAKKRRKTKEDAEFNPKRRSERKAKQKQTTQKKEKEPLNLIPIQTKKISEPNEENQDLGSKKNEQKEDKREDEEDGDEMNLIDEEEKSNGNEIQSGSENEEIAKKTTRNKRSKQKRQKKDTKSSAAAKEWNHFEDEKLLNLVKESNRHCNDVKWKEVANAMPGRTAAACNQHFYRVVDPRICREAWSEEEDVVLWKLLANNKCWKEDTNPRYALLSQQMEKELKVVRPDTQIRYRFVHHIRPILNEKWNDEEDAYLVKLIRQYQNIILWKKVSKMFQRHFPNAIGKSPTACLIS